MRILSNPLLGNICGFSGMPGSEFVTLLVEIYLHEEVTGTENLLDLWCRAGVLVQANL